MILKSRHVALYFSYYIPKARKGDFKKNNETHSVDQGYRVIHPVLLIVVIAVDAPFCPVTAHYNFPYVCLFKKPNLKRNILSTPIIS